MRIVFPEKLILSDKQREKFENVLTNAVATLSKNLDITGLSNIYILERIESIHPSVTENSVMGEVITKGTNPLKFDIKIVGTIFDMRLIENKETIVEFVNALHHELAHIHDHNKIPGLYAEKAMLHETLSQENAIWGFALKIWSEFIATQLSSNGKGYARVEREIKALNMICGEMAQENGRKRFRLSIDVLCSMAYLLGDIIGHEDLAKEIDEKIDVGVYTPFLERLYDELKTLLKTYPQWNDLSVLQTIKDIVQDFVNATYEAEE